MTANSACENRKERKMGALGQLGRACGCTGSAEQVSKGRYAHMLKHCT